MSALGVPRYARRTCANLSRGRRLRTPMAETVRAMHSIAEASIAGQAISLPLEPFHRTPPLVFVIWRIALLGIPR